MTEKSNDLTYAVFNDDHIERCDDTIRSRGWDWFTDLYAAQFALQDYLMDDHEGTNLRSKKAGAEDRDHMLSCIITTLAMGLPAFAEVGAEKACQAVSEVVDQWLEVPKKAVEPEPELPDVTDNAPIGLQRNPMNDYDFARLNLAVYAGDGACGDTVRMVFQGLIDINSKVEWVEDIGDGEPIKHRELVCVKAIVELDDLSPALVCEMLHSNGNPRHETRVLRFSSITNVEVG